MARRALVSTVARGLVQVQRGGRVLDSAAHALEGVALSACDAAELGHITDRCYAGAPEDTREGLFDWELEWFERDLPRRPAQLLIGGCGNGRELRFLQGRGYAVVGFDPVTSRSPGPILGARYEDLLRPDHPAYAWLIARMPFDAVVLGWGSFSHVPGAANRLAVLRALRSLSDGPVLLSYWSHRGPGASISRARALGQTIGRRLRAPNADAGAAQDRVAPHCGYAHCFGEQELRTLAASAGYATRCHGGVYAHATLTPFRDDSGCPQQSKNGARDPEQASR